MMMKKDIFKIGMLAFLMLLLQACQTDVLDATAPDRYTDASLWTDINLADAYLLSAYDGLAMGYGPVMIPSVTDDVRHEFTWGPQNYVQGNITADDTQPFVTEWDSPEIPNWSTNFQTIQTINVFLKNIERVPDAYEGSEKETIQERVNVMKGEALFLRAYTYGQLLRMYGGVPILKEPNERGDDFLSITRATFEETVEFISNDYAAAAELLLGKEEMEMGRATKGAALALRSRLLLFAASDLTADGSAENDLVGYENPDRTALWTAAKDAAKAVIDLGTYSLADFGAPDKAAVAQNYYEFFKQKDLSNNEIIWGKMYLKSAGDANQMNLWNGANGNNNWAGHNPTQGLVDTYQMEDGSSFFDHFKLNEDGFYVNISDKYESENIYDNREPRFYGSILYDGAIWQPRFPNLAGRDPVGIYDRRTRIITENGETTTIYGIDTRQGPVENWNGSFTGYIMRKLLDDEVIGKNENNENVYIEIRYAEILLNYAEALIELGETAEAATYINMIRNRVGMPDFTGDIEEALRHERHLELAFEGVRWYDIRRWKVLEEKLHDAMGINIVEIIVDGTSVETTWERILTEDREVFERMYWAPIPSVEVNKAPQLVPNPGY